MDELLTLRVDAVRGLPPQIRELELRSADDAPLPRFRAGAHPGASAPNPAARHHDVGRVLSDPPNPARRLPEPCGLREA